MVAFLAMRTPDYKWISIGSAMLFVFAVAAIIGACVLLGIAVGDAGKLGHGSPEMTMQCLTALCLLGYGILVALVASVALAIRDIAINSFR